MKRQLSNRAKVRRTLRPVLQALASLRDMLPALMPWAGLVVVAFFLSTMVPHVESLFVGYEDRQATAWTFALASETAVAVMSLMYQFQIGRRPLMFVAMSVFLAASAFFQREYYVRHGMTDPLATVASVYLPLAVALVSYAIGHHIATVGRRQPARTDDRSADRRQRQPAQSALTLTETTTRKIAATGKSAAWMQRQMQARQLAAQKLPPPEIARQMHVSIRSVGRYLAASKEVPRE